MKYTQKQLRRFFQELGFDPDLLGYEILLVALDITMNNPSVIYEDTMDHFYEMILDTLPWLNQNKVRKNSETLINKWWNNPQIEHPLKLRIQQNNHNRIGIRLIILFMRDELLSREE